MNIPFSLKPAAASSFTTAPFQSLLRFVRFAFQQLARRDDPAALRYAANKYTGEID